MAKQNTINKSCKIFPGHKNNIWVFMRKFFFVAEFATVVNVDWY